MPRANHSLGVGRRDACTCATGTTLRAERGTEISRPKARNFCLRNPGRARVQPFEPKKHARKQNDAASPCHRRSCVLCDQRAGGRCKRRERAHRHCEDSSTGIDICRVRRCHERQRGSQGGPSRERRPRSLVGQNGATNPDCNAASARARQYVVNSEDLESTSIALTRLQPWSLKQSMVSQYIPNVRSRLHRLLCMYTSQHSKDAAIPVVDGKFSVTGWAWDPQGDANVQFMGVWIVPVVNSLRLAHRGSKLHATFATTCVQ